MAHDVLAELAGYQNELAREVQLGRDERAAAIRDQIARVRSQISASIDALEAEYENLVEAGKDLQAAQAAIRARELSRALGESMAADSNLEPDSPQPDPDDEPVIPPDDDPGTKEQPVSEQQTDDSKDKPEPAKPEPEPQAEPEERAEPAAETATETRPRRTAAPRSKRSS